MASARRSLLLPTALAAFALCAVLSACCAFVGSSAPPAVGASLRAGTQTRHALPVDLVEGSSLATSLAVTTAAWWANIVLLIIPLTFLIILYLQSERTLAEGRK
mmetsp:Transcript_58347/g.147945  ORF Transcript_58347/g.147945 Transcript_58347/m.147945 type:complete len:104 (+) Transcript_58347:67-378(+)